MELSLFTTDASWRRTTGLTHGENWREAAACRDTDPELFFPLSESGKSLDQVAEAKAICAGCPVRQPCLAFALRTGQAHGIWGGLTEEERRRDLSPLSRPRSAFMRRLQSGSLLQVPGTKRLRGRSSP